MTNAKTCKGIKLGVEVTSGSTTTTYWFNEVKAVPEIGAAPAKVDCTHLTSEIHEYVADIPDYSSDLTFTMNAQPLQSSPSSVSDSNLNLIRALQAGKSYTWKIIYPQHRMKCEVVGEWTWSMGAASVGGVLECSLTIIPSSAPVWTEYSTSCTVTYDANGGSGTMTDASSPYTSGSSVTTKTNTFTAPSGKTWASWNTNASGTGISYDASDAFVIYENVTLYAIWTEVE